MSVELDTSFDPLNRDYLLKTYCKPAYRVKWLKNKGAILILTWNYLVWSVYFLFRAGYREKQLKNPFHETDTGIIMWCMAILCPIGGWLADTRIGRYKVIHYSMLFMWIGVVLTTIGELVLTNINIGTANDTVLSTGVYTCLSLFTMVGFVGFVSNILHLGIDQLTDASANEITSFIMWYTMTLSTSGITVHYISDCVEHKHTFYIKTFIVAICLTVALCSDFLFHHILVKEQVAGKPLRVIIGVVRYIIKNRHLRYTTRNEASSSFDIAKHMYGGPYTSQQVDNVRKFLWMLLIIAASTIVLGAVQPISFAQEKEESHLKLWKKTSVIRECYKNLTLRYGYFFFVVVLVILYEFIIHPLFYRCLPRIRITTKFLFATVVFFIWILSLLVIETVIYHELITTSNYTSKTCAFVRKSDISTLNHKWLVIPSFLEGLCNVLMISSALEFIWAQTPSTMKGLLLGIGYTFIGISTLFHTVLAAPFIFKSIASHIEWANAPLSCEIWYFLLVEIIILFVLVAATIVVKKYNRQKERSTYFDPYAS